MLRQSHDGGCNAVRSEVTCMVAVAQLQEIAKESAANMDGMERAQPG